MVTMKLDSTGVDVTKSATGFEVYDGPPASPGVYAAEIRTMRVKVSGAGNMYFNILFVLSDQNSADKQKFKGYPHWEMITPGESDFQKERVGKLLAGICGKTKANVDHDEVTDGGKVNKVGGKDPVGAKFKIVLRRDGTDPAGEPQLRIGDLFPWPKGEEWPTGEGFESEDDDPEDEVEEDEEAEEEEDVEEDDSDEEEDDEEEEEDDEEEEDEEDDGEFDARQEELNDLDRSALKAILKEHSATFKVLKKHSDDDLRTFILDAEFPVEGEDPPF